MDGDFPIGWIKAVQEDMEGSPLLPFNTWHATQLKPYVLRRWWQV